jgi:hypothetical protein
MMMGIGKITDPNIVFDNKSQKTVRFIDESAFVASNELQCLSFRPTAPGDNGPIHTLRFLTEKDWVLPFFCEIILKYKHRSCLEEWMIKEIVISDCRESLLYWDYGNSEKKVVEIDLTYAKEDYWFVENKDDEIKRIENNVVIEKI